MKYYKVSDEELKKIYEIGNYDGGEDKWDMSPFIRRFLKSKIPLPEPSKDAKLDRDKVGKIIFECARYFFNINRTDQVSTEKEKKKMEKLTDQIMQLTPQPQTDRMFKVDGDSITELTPQITEEDITSTIRSVIGMTDIGYSETVDYIQVKEISAVIIKRMGE